MTKRKAVVEVVQDDEKPIAKEVLALAIVKISEAMNRLLKSGITERAIICLIHDSIPTAPYGGGKVAGRPAIKAVLDSLKLLRDRYCS